MAVVVVYGGGFQPFHAGHLSSYVEAKRAFPDAEFFVAASNDVKQRPIPFKVKKFLAQQAGVRDAFVEVRQPLNPKEILEIFDPAKDIFVLVRSERDPMPYTKKDGSPAYFQPFVSLDQCNPYGKNAYVLVTKKKDFTVNGQEVYSGSQVRDMYTNADDVNKEQIISQLYPKSSHKDTIKQVLDQYLQSTPKTVLEPKVPAAKQLKNKKLAEMIKQARPLLKEASIEKKVKFLKLLKDYAITNIEEAVSPTYGDVIKTRNKIAQQTNPTRNKFIWKRPNQIRGSYTDQQLISQGFRKSAQNNVWGGTQDMWNRLSESLNEFAPPNSDRGDGGNDRSRRIRKLLEIAIQVAKEKNVDELGMIHAMNMIAGDEFFNTAVEGILPDITDKEYMFVLQSAYKTVKQGLAEAKRKRKKKSKNRSVGRYFFPGYSYYGGGESGESGGDGGGESMAEDSLNELAPSTSGEGDNNYLKTLARAWYNMEWEMLGDLVKQGKNPLEHRMKVQDAIENMLERGIHCPDGKVRKYFIGYNAEFDGVEIQSNDHYEYGDNDDAGNDIDSRTGKPWGPYDAIEFAGNELNESMAEGSLNELAPGGSGSSGDDDKYIPPDFGKPFKANYLGQNKFQVFCRRPQDPSNVITLIAEVQKYGLEWDDDSGFWFLDSPGAVYLSWKYGEIPLPKAIDQARNPGHIHDLVTDYLTNSPHASEIQKIATEYFGFTTDGEMNEGEVIPFKQPSKTLTWKQVPRDILLLANDWFWASEDNSGLDATLDPEGFGNGTANDVKYNAAKLQQKGWAIDYNYEYDGPGEFNLRLTNKRGQTVLLSIEDAQTFTGWAKGTSQYDLEEGPVVPRIMNPKVINIYVRIGKNVKLVATDIPYQLLDKYIDKVIQKYPQFKPDDFSFKDSDKVTEDEVNQDYLNEK